MDAPVFTETWNSAMQDDDQDTWLPTKKRRVPGACDACKRKKIRCDSAQRPDNRCSNCAHLTINCTHTEVGKTLGSARRYVESLEARLEKMDRLINKLIPGVNINHELEKLDQEESQTNSTVDKLPRNDDATSAITSQLVQLSLLNPLRARYYGKSSNIQLLKSALELKWFNEGRMHQGPVPDWRREEFWDIPKWTEMDKPEESLQLPSPYEFPPKDLMVSLIDLYFTQLNPLLPLLHRPIFERSIKQGLHLRNPQFGATVLLVCAQGAKYSDDPRVLADGSETWFSAGWKWYKQVRLLAQQIPSKCTLYDIQMYALISHFGMQCPIPENTWLQSGLGLRLAVDVGVHTKANKKETPTQESELWKRAFWCLYYLDVRYSAAVGRCSSLREEDFDQDYPVECDDEYWDEGFRQPAGKPSNISFFNAMLKLTAILNQSLYLLYSLKRPHNPLLKASPRSEHECVIELDSKLNDWLASLPTHLRQGSNRRNEIFKSQNIYLHLTFYHHQIVIHRPYIPTPRNPVPGPLPSLAICSNAARSCCRILFEARKTDSRVMGMAVDALFTAALCLVFCAWSRPRARTPPSETLEEQDIMRCVSLLGEVEHRISLAGRLKDIIHNLYTCRGRNTGGVTLASLQNKRPREESPARPLAEASTRERAAQLEPDLPTPPNSLFAEQSVFVLPKTTDHSEFSCPSQLTSATPQSHDTTSFAWDLGMPDIPVTFSESSFLLPAENDMGDNNVNGQHLSVQNSAREYDPPAMPATDLALGSPTTASMYRDILALWPQTHDYNHQMDSWNSFWSLDIAASAFQEPEPEIQGDMAASV